MIYKQDHTVDKSLKAQAFIVITDLFVFMRNTAVSHSHTILPIVQTALEAALYISESLVNLF